MMASLTLFLIYLYGLKENNEPGTAACDRHLIRAYTVCDEQDFFCTPKLFGRLEFSFNIQEKYTYVQF